MRDLWPDKDCLYHSQPVWIVSCWFFKWRKIFWYTVCLLLSLQHVSALISILVAFSADKHCADKHWVRCSSKWERSTGLIWMPISKASFVSDYWMFRCCGHYTTEPISLSRHYVYLVHQITRDPGVKGWKLADISLRRNSPGTWWVFSALSWWRSATKRNQINFKFQKLACISAWSTKLELD